MEDCTLDAKKYVEMMTKQVFPAIRKAYAGEEKVIVQHDGAPGHPGNWRARGMRNPRRLTPPSGYAEPINPKQHSSAGTGTKSACKSQSGTGTNLRPLLSQDEKYRAYTTVGTQQHSSSA